VGLAGALVAALSLCVPSSLLLLALGHRWCRGGGAPLRRAAERGMVPVAVELIVAGVVTLVRGDETGWFGTVTIAACAAALLRGASPWLVMLAAAAGHAGLRGALG